MTDSFSERYRYSLPPDQPLIREDAPEQLRCFLIKIVIDEMHYAPKFLRSIVCDTLLVRPDTSNWSEYPNIYNEVEGLIHNAQWYQIYDIIEALARSFEHQHRLDEFADYINAGFIRLGIGWNLDGTVIVTRGDEVFQATIHTAAQALEETGYARAHKELKEALSDLSRRPEPDLTGTVQHAIGALESVAKEVSGETTSTLGAILKDHLDLIPKPLDIAIEKIWGYSSDVARHIREDRDISREEAQLVLGVSASIIAYLMDKIKEQK
jgi:hypothetical protein